MRRVGWALLGVAGILVACGGDEGPARAEPSIVAVPWTSPASPPSAAPSVAPAGPAAEVSPLPDNLRVSIDVPDANALVKTPVSVSGVASVHGGTVVAVVLDESDAELGRATTTASAVYPAFGRYTLAVPFSGATSGAKGKLRVFGVNPRDGKETWFYWINVRFP